MIGKIFGVYLSQQTSPYISMRNFYPCWSQARPSVSAMFSEPTAARILPRLWLTCTVTPEQSGTIPGTGGNRQMVYRQFIYLSGGFLVDHCAEPAIIQHERSIARSKGRTLISSLQGSNESFLLTQSADVLLYSMRSRHCRKRAEI